MSEKRGAQLYNHSLEQILIGGLIVSPNSFWEMEHALGSSTFHAPLHREMFNVLADLIRLGQTPTIPLLCGRLPEEFADPSGKDISVRTYITICTDKAEDVSPHDVYEELVELAAKRDAMRVAENIIKDIEKGEKRSDQIVVDAEDRLISITQSLSPNRPEKMGDIVKRAVRKIKEANKDYEEGKPKATLHGLSTGVAALDQILGKMYPGDFGCIIASQSDGKTAMAQQIGMHVAQNEIVLMIEMEMSNESLAFREMAAKTGMPLARLNGDLNPHEIMEIEETVQSLQSPNFYALQPKGEFRLRRLKAEVLSFSKRVGKPALIVIDQLDKLLPDKTNHRSGFDEKKEITSFLKGLALELETVIILLAQRTRMAQRADSPVPDVNDAEAPSLERDCDFVLGIWRMESWLRKREPNDVESSKYERWLSQMKENENTANAIMLKLRRGKRFQKCQMRWDGQRTRFSDI